jgi:hypothetical protein
MPNRLDERQGTVVLDSVFSMQELIDVSLVWFSFHSFRLQSPCLFGLVWFGLGCRMFSLARRFT